MRKGFSQLIVVALLRAIEKANQEPPGFGIGYFGRRIFVSEDTARKYMRHCQEQGLLVLEPRPGHTYWITITDEGRELLG